MASRSLNKVFLIGNLTRDPELRYTPSGTAVCTFGLATNRQWTTDEGGKKEEAEFHTIVAWNRLAEIVTEYLKKGRQAYVEGRLSTREWEAQDGTKRRTTEIIANEIIFLGGSSPSAEDFDVPSSLGSNRPEPTPSQLAEAVVPDSSSVEKTVLAPVVGAEKTTEEESEDIPF